MDSAKVYRMAVEIVNTVLGDEVFALKEDVFEQKVREVLAIIEREVATDE